MDSKSLLQFEMVEFTSETEGENGQIKFTFYNRLEFGKSKMIYVQQMTPKQAKRLRL